MGEDFALIDFAFSARPPEEIVAAIGRIEAAEARAARERGRAAAAGGGFLSRLFRASGPRQGAAAVPAGLLIQPDGSLPPAPLARTRPEPVPDDPAGLGPTRLTAPLGEARLTLVEFLAGDGETVQFCEALSREFRGDEIFCFRHSGALHPGAHYAFHVYQDGRATRRAASVSARGTAPEAAWTGIDAGMPHPVEVDSLPPPGIPDFEIMTPMRQGSILAALGLDPDRLFAPPGPEMAVLELTRDPGGAALAEAPVILAHRQRRQRPTLRAVAGGMAPTPTPAPAQATDDPSGPPDALPTGTEPQPAAAAAAAAGMSAAAAPGPVPDRVRTAPTPPPVPEAPAALPADISADAPVAGRAGGGSPFDSVRPPWERPGAALSWEEEVTTILVRAVESALAPDEQVAWLDMLTRHLELGELDTALGKALEMIAAGRRPEAARAAAAKRLSELFGRRLQGGGSH